MPRFALRWSELRATLERAERWLLPGACLLCGETIRPPSRRAAEPPDPLLCGPCLGRFSSLPRPQCARCGQPLTPGIACRLCAGWPERLSGVQSAVWLEDAARRAVHLLKYGGWRRLADPMADLMVRRIGSLRADRPTLVPIPLSAGRERNRGYNQSAALARELGKRLGVPVQEALRRGRDTGTQTALTPQERRANLAGAFRPAGPPPSSAVLVDDVFTTGATLAEAGQVLLAAGADRVTGVTFARALRPLAESASTLTATL